MRLCRRYRQRRARGKKAHQVVGAIARELSALMWAMAHQVPITPSILRPSWPWMAPPPGFSSPSAEVQPRYGATLVSVKRVNILAPRARQAPDGYKEGGSQPTASSRINRRVLLAPPLAMDAMKQEKANAKHSVANS